MSCRIKKKVLFNPSTLKVIRDSATKKVQYVYDFPPCEWIEGDLYHCADVWWPTHNLVPEVSRYMIMRVEGVDACALDWVTAKQYYFPYRCKKYHDGYYHYYKCKTSHVSSSATEPGVGANWRAYWDLMINNPGDPDASEINGVYRLYYESLPNYGGWWECHKNMSGGSVLSFRFLPYFNAFGAIMKVQILEYIPYSYEFWHFVSDVVTGYVCSDCFPIVINNTQASCTGSEFLIGKGGTATILPPAGCECE